MAKPEWGTKRTCHNCGSRFYDLRREPIVCPVCDTVFTAERGRPRRGGGASKPEPAAAAAAAAAAEPAAVPKEAEAEAAEDEALAAADDAAEDKNEAEGETMDDLEGEERQLIEDPADLGEDDDDIGEVMEHLDDDEDKA